MRHRHFIRADNADIKGEECGEGKTEKLQKYAIYQKMLADWFNEASRNCGQ